MIYKKLVLGLLILVTLSSILFRPGNGIFENFVRGYHFQDVKSLSIPVITNYYFTYPPLVQTLFTKILHLYPVAQNLDHFGFYASTAYFLFKLSLYIAYLLTFISLLIAGNLLKKAGTNRLLDSGLKYFGSAGVILISLALTYLDIYTVPLFIVIFILLFKRRPAAAATLYLFSLLANWMFILFAPIFLLVSWKILTQSWLTRFYSLINYCLIPGFLLTLFGALLLFDKSQFIVNYFSSKSFSLYWFVNQPLEYLAKITSRKVEIKMISGLVALLVFIVANLLAGYMMKNLFFNNSKYKIKILRFLPYVLTAMIFFVSLVFTNSLFLPFLAIFFAYYVKILIVFIRNKDYTVKSLTNTLFLIISVYLLLSPTAGEGNLLWLIVISLLNQFLNPSKEGRLRLILINILVFINFFVYFGVAGYVPIPGLYFESFRYVVFTLYLLFLVSTVNKLSINWSK